MAARVALFGNKEEKLAQDQAAEAEASRLQSLTAGELAAEVLPAFGPEGARPGHEINALQVSNWLMSAYPRGTKQLKNLQQPVREAIQALENAGLVIDLSRGGGPGGRLKITREGEAALADGSVAQRLG